MTFPRGRHMKTSVACKSTSFVLSLSLFLFPLPAFSPSYASNPLSLEDLNPSPASDSYSSVGQTVSPFAIPSGAIMGDDSGLMFASSVDTSAQPMPASFSPSEVPGNPKVSTQGYNSLGKNYPLVGYVTLKPLERTQFSYRYDVGAARGSAVDVQVQSDEGPMNLGESFYIGLKRVNDSMSSPGISPVTVIFTDASGNALVRTAEVTDEMITYRFDLNEGGFRSDAVLSVTFRLRYEDMAKSTDRRGEIFISLKGAKTPLPVYGTPYDETRESLILGGAETFKEGFAREEGRLPGYITLLDREGGDYGYRYCLFGSGAAAVRGGFVAQGVPLLLNETLSLALQNTGGDSRALVRVTDSLGREARYVVILKDFWQVYDLDLEDTFYVESGFDRTQVVRIEIETDRTLSPVLRGEIGFRFLNTGVAEDPFTNLKPAVTGTGEVITFSELQEAVIYQVQVSKDPDFTQIIHEGFPPSSPEVYNLTESGLYYARVRGSKNQLVEQGPVSQWSDTVTFNWVEPDIAGLKPVIESALSDRRGNVSIVFSGVPGAIVYRVEIAADQFFRNIVRSLDLAGPVENLTALNDGNYYIRIQASSHPVYGAGELSDWSDAVTVVVDSITNDKPVIESVVSNSGGDSWVTFSSLDQAVVYQLQISRNSSFTDVVHNLYPSGSPVNMVLSEYRTYYVRARGSLTQDFAAENASQWSQTFIFDRVIGPDNIFPDPQLTGGDLPGLPAGQTGPAAVTSVGPGGTAIDQAVSTPRGALITYQTGTEGWSGGGFSYDDFSTGAVETGNLSGLTHLIFGLKGSSDVVKLELVDNTGKKAGVYLRGISMIEEKIWKINTAFFTGVNLAEIRLIYFIVEGANKSGTLEVSQKPPVQDILPDVLLTSRDITDWPLGQAGPATVTSVGPGGTATDKADPTNRGVKITYNTGTEGWSGGGFAYDNFSTGAVESGDWNSLDEVVVGMQGTPEVVKFEVVDASGKSAHVYLRGIQSGTEQFWKIPLSRLAGINLAQIRIVYFIVEGVEAQGTLYVNRMPKLVPDPSLNGADITPLPAGTGGPLLVTSVGPGTGGATDSAAATSRGVLVTYNTGTPGWAGGGFTYDNFSTPAVESGNLSGFGQMVFGIKGSAPVLKLELVDASGKSAFVYLYDIRSDLEQFWTIPLNLFDGIDLTAIRLIYFIVEGSAQQGTFEVNRIPAN